MSRYVLLGVGLLLCIAAAWAHDDATTTPATMSSGFPSSQASTQTTGHEGPKLLFTINMKHDNGGSAALSPDGKVMALARWRAGITLLDMSAGKITVTFEVHNSGLTPLAFSPDGKTLASSDSDTKIKLWDVATGKVSTTFEVQTKPINAVAFSPDGKTLASGSDDATIKCWDLVSAKNTATLDAKANGVVFLVYSPDDKTLACGTRGGTVLLWDIASGKSTTLLERRGAYYTIPIVAFSPDGKYVVVAWRSTEEYLNPKGVVRLCDAVTGKQLVALEGNDPGGCWIVGFADEGKTLVSVGSQGEIKVWESAGGKNITTFYLGRGANEHGSIYTHYIPVIRGAKVLDLGGWVDDELDVWEMKVPLATSQPDSKPSASTAMSAK